MQSRTFLRIEGDLVSLVTEMTDREVTLPDLLTELTSNQLAMTPVSRPAARGGQEPRFDRAAAPWYS
jgi:hypothetical protein